jgi:hypothetical protein
MLRLPSVYLFLTTSLLWSTLVIPALSQSRPLSKQFQWKFINDVRLNGPPLSIPLILFLGPSWKSSDMCAARYSRTILGYHVERHLWDRAILHALIRNRLDTTNAVYWDEQQVVGMDSQTSAGYAVVRALGLLS